MRVRLDVPAPEDIVHGVREEEVAIGGQLEARYNILVPLELEQRRLRAAQVVRAHDAIEAAGVGVRTAVADARRRHGVRVRDRLLRHAFRRLHFCLQQSHTLAQLAILASLGADALQQQASKRAEKKKQARVEAGGELTRLLVAEAASIERSCKTHIQHHAKL